MNPSHCIEASAKWNLSMKGGTLRYVNIAAVRALEHGEILIPEGSRKLTEELCPVGIQTSDRRTRLTIDTYCPGITQPNRKPEGVRIWPLQLLQEPRRRNTYNPFPPRTYPRVATSGFTQNDLAPSWKALGMAGFSI